MEKGINLATNDFKIQLMKDISLANLPPCIVRNVLSDLLVEVSRLETKAIQDEQLEYEKSIKEKSLKNINKPTAKKPTGKKEEK